MSYRVTIATRPGMTAIERDTAAFLRKIRREKIREPGPDQFVDECHFCKTGWGIWERDEHGRAHCTCAPARVPR